MSLYKKKSTGDFTPEDTIAEKVRGAAGNGFLSCAAAFKLADRLDISCEEIGRYADTLGLRLAKCRIGLFGHGKGVKLVKKLDTIDKTLESRVNEFVKDGRVNCEHVLKIADEFRVSPVHVGSVCQTRGVKIKNCCLGAF